jgi:DNA polymerase III delta prime subunit
MHAYLLENYHPEALMDFAKKLGKKIFEFPISKIDDVRKLKGLLKLTQPEKIVIVCKDIDQATTEALNAFLKNLEEPKENVSFVLTVKNKFSLPQTIVSRCQIIKNSQKTPHLLSNQAVEEFLTSTTDGKLKIIDKINTRQQAVEFVKEIVLYLSERLLNSLDSKIAAKDIKDTATQLESAQSTLQSLQANGNIRLQLTNMVARMSK